MARLFPQPADYIVSCASRSSWLFHRYGARSSATSCEDATLTGLLTTSGRWRKIGRWSPLLEERRCVRVRRASVPDRSGRPAGRQTSGTRLGCLPVPWGRSFRAGACPYRRAGFVLTLPTGLYIAGGTIVVAVSFLLVALVPAANLRMVERAVWRAGRVPEHLLTTLSLISSSRPWPWCSPGTTGPRIRWPIRCLWRSGRSGGSA